MRSRHRQITPREAWRIQGYPNHIFNRAQEAVGSDTELYGLAGNSVTVNVIYEIANRLG